MGPLRYMLNILYNYSIVRTERIVTKLIKDPINDNIPLLLYTDEV